MSDFDHHDLVNDLNAHMATTPPSQTPKWSNPNNHQGREMLGCLLVLALVIGGIVLVFTGFGIPAAIACFVGARRAFVKFVKW